MIQSKIHDKHIVWPQHRRHRTKRPIQVGDRHVFIVAFGKGQQIVVADLAQRMNIKSGEVVKQLMKLGTMATANQAIDRDRYLGACFLEHKLNESLIVGTIFDQQQVSAVQRLAFWQRAARSGKRCAAGSGTTDRTERTGRKIPPAAQNRGLNPYNRADGPKRESSSHGYVPRTGRNLPADAVSASWRSMVATAIRHRVRPSASSPIPPLRSATYHKGRR